MLYSMCCWGFQHFTSIFRCCSCSSYFVRHILFSFHIFACEMEESLVAGHCLDMSFELDSKFGFSCLIGELLLLVVLELQLLSSLVDRFDCCWRYDGFYSQLRYGVLGQSWHLASWMVPVQQDLYSGVLFTDSDHDFPWPTWAAKITTELWLSPDSIAAIDYSYYSTSAILALCLLSVVHLPKLYAAFASASTTPFDLASLRYRFIVSRFHWLRANWFMKCLGIVQLIVWKYRSWQCTAMSGDDGPGCGYGCCGSLLGVGCVLCIAAVAIVAPHYSYSSWWLTLLLADICSQAWSSHDFCLNLEFLSHVGAICSHWRSSSPTTDFALPKTDYNSYCHYLSATCFVDFSSIWMQQLF